MKEIKSLLLIWQDKNSSSYFHVGTLSYDGEYYTFVYTQNLKGNRTLKEAKKLGYRLHPAFPDETKEYKSNTLFSAFDRRIPSESRVDYKEVLESLGLDENADRMDILQETRGKLSGDSYSFERPIRVNNNREFSTSFYVNGMRHIDNLPKSWAQIVSQEGTVVFIMEPENHEDPNAIRVETVSGIKLGYVPSIYTTAIGSLIDLNIPLKISITDIRPQSQPQWWLRLTIEANLEEKGMEVTNDMMVLVA